MCAFVELMCAGICSNMQKCHCEFLPALICLTHQSRNVFHYAWICGFPLELHRHLPGSTVTHSLRPFYRYFFPCCSSKLKINHLLVNLLHANYMHNTIVVGKKIAWKLALVTKLLRRVSLIIIITCFFFFHFAGKFKNFWILVQNSFHWIKFVRPIMHALAYKKTDCVHAVNGRKVCATAKTRFEAFRACFYE